MVRSFGQQLKRQQAFLQWIGAVGTLLLLGFVFAGSVEAIPASFDWGSFDAAGSAEYGVYEADGVTVLESDDLVQLIWAGPDGQIDIPYSNGEPGGDDLLLDSNRINNDQPLPPPQRNKGYVPLKTHTFNTDDPQNGGAIYLRAWNASIASQATGYGNSETGILSNGGALNVPRWEVINGPTAVTLSSIEANSESLLTGYAASLAGLLAVITLFLTVRKRQTL